MITDLLTPLLLSLPKAPHHKYLLDTHNVMIQKDDGQWMTSPPFDFTDFLSEKEDFWSIAVESSFVSKAPPLHAHGGFYRSRQMRSIFSDFCVFAIPKFIEPCFMTKELQLVGVSSSSSVQVSGGWIAKKSTKDGGSLKSGLVLKSVCMPTEEAMEHTTRSWSLDDLPRARQEGSFLKIGNRRGRLCVALNMPEGGCWWWALNAFVQMDKTSVPLTYSTDSAVLEMYATVNGIPISRDKMPDWGIWIVPCGSTWHALAIKPVDWIRRQWAAVPLMPRPDTLVKSSAKNWYSWRREVDECVLSSVQSQSFGLGQDWESDWYKYTCTRKIEPQSPCWDDWEVKDLSKTFCIWWKSYMMKDKTPVKVSGSLTEEEVLNVSLVLLFTWTVLNAKKLLKDWMSILMIIVLSIVHMELLAKALVACIQIISVTGTQALRLTWKVCYGVWLDLGVEGDALVWKFTKAKNVVLDALSLDPIVREFLGARRALLTWWNPLNYYRWIKEDSVPCIQTNSCLARKPRFRIVPWTVYEWAQFYFGEFVSYLSRDLAELVKIVLACLKWIVQVGSMALGFHIPLTLLCLVLGMIYDGWVKDLVVSCFTDTSVHVNSMRVPYPLKDNSLLLGLYAGKENCAPDGKHADIHEVKDAHKVVRYDARGWNAASQDLSGLSVSALSVLTSNGVGSSNQDRLRTSQTHHGHQYLRKCSDLMRFKNEVLMKDHMKKRLSLDPNAKFLLINVGAKLGADSSRWRQVFGMSNCIPTIHAVHIRPQDEEAGNKENWRNSGKKPGFGVWEGVEFEWTEHVSVGKDTPKEKRITHYRSIYREDFFQGRLQDWVSANPGFAEGYDVLVGMNDCHYYFSDPLPAEPSLRDARLFVSGLNFPTVPGEYKLPDNGGTLKIHNGKNGYIKVWMKPYLNEKGYFHDWLHVPAPTVVINSGWIQHFATTTVWSEWAPTRLKNIPTDHTSWYPQTDILKAELNALAGDEWKRYWFQNSWSKVTAPVDLQILGKWLFSQIRDETCSESVQLLLKGVQLDTVGQKYLAVPRSSWRSKLIRVDLAERWFADAYIVKDMPHLHSIGGIQVSGWDATKAADWNPTWTTWREHLANVKMACKTAKPKTEKVPSSESWTVREDYFEIKPITVSDLSPNRALMAPVPEARSQWIVDLGSYLTAKLLTARPRDVRKTSHGVKTRTATGSAVSYEWCSKSPLNLLYAMFNRQMKSKLKPDPVVLEDFKLWFEKWFDERFAKITWAPEIKPWREWISDNSAWDAAKKEKYTSTFLKQSAAVVWRTADWVYAFCAMVKSGEVYFRWQTVRDAFNCLLGRDDRPRLIFSPSANACGPITWIQQFMFRDLKKVIPGFIQAMTSDSLKEVILANKPADSKCCSSDGSSFDSHQHVEIMRIVDDYVWKKFSPRILEVCQQHFPHPQVMHQGLLWQAMQHDAKLFFQLPGFEEMVNEKWCANSAVRRFFPVSGKDWLELELLGTTFSGQPVKTTLGNTIRSIAYHEYLCHKAKIDDLQKFVIASGDDVCCWISESKVEAYKQAINTYTHTGTDDVSKGLGQCIKEMKVSDWWDMDFCSKRCYLQGDDWIICRDGSKIWKEKMEYVGKLDIFHKEPERHLMAMADSATAEVPSRLIDEFYRHRLQMVKKRLRESNSSTQGEVKTRIDRIDDWLGNRKCLQEWRKENRLAMVRASKRIDWDNSTELGVVANRDFFSSAGWGLSTFIQFFGGSLEVSLD
jgi:hypothetical protein